VTSKGIYPNTVRTEEPEVMSTITKDYELSSTFNTQTALFTRRKNMNKNETSQLLAKQKANILNKLMKQTENENTSNFCARY
jgi:hypothetical protein